LKCLRFTRSGSKDIKELENQSVWQKLISF